MELYLYFGIDDTVSNEGAVNNNNKFIYLYKSIYEGLPKSKLSYFFYANSYLFSYIYIYASEKLNSS